MRKDPMPARLPCCLVLAAVCGLPLRTASAQARPWNDGQRYLSMEPPASAAYGPGNPIGATSYPQWGDPPFGGGGMWANDTVDGNVYGFGTPGHMGYPDAYGYPPGSGPYGPGGPPGMGYAPPGSPQYAFDPQGGAPAGYPGANTLYEMLPQDRGLLYDEDITAIKRFGSRMRGSWVRMEYLDWEMRNPGNTLLGAPLVNVEDPRQPFLVQALDTTGNLVTVGSARVMDMSPIDLRHLQGARLSAGIPTEYGELLGSFWGVESATGFGAPELTFPDPANINTNPNAVFVATSLLDNGSPGSLLVLYDDAFSVKYNVKTYGGDINLGFNLRDPVDGWRLEALVGYKHTSHTEDLTQNGVFNNRSSLDVPNVVPPLTVNLIDPPIVNQISSSTANRFNAMQFGLRSEWESRWIALGIEPKIAFGANNMTAEVQTIGLRNSQLNPQQEDPVVTTKLKKTYFAPMFDLGLYARLNVTEWFSVNVGYNFMWMDNVARADEVIYYNDNGLANPPDVVVRPPQKENLWLKGISVGGQITFPR